MKRILICGGRRFGLIPPSYDPTYMMKRAERDRALATLDELFAEYDKDDLVIIQGGADGGDSIAKEWAAKNSVQTEEYKADWIIYGKGAGHIRNRKMLNEGNPNEVWAFPGGPGTQNMKMISMDKGIPVKNIK